MNILIILFVCHHERQIVFNKRYNTKKNLYMFIIILNNNDINKEINIYFNIYIL